MAAVALPLALIEDRTIAWAAAVAGLCLVLVILVAIAASLGMPFVISTPPNAMVYGEGGVKSTDLLLPGLTLMILGCLLLALTGPFVLRLAGI